jgi:hypothetical protein
MPYKYKSSIYLHFFTFFISYSVPKMSSQGDLIPFSAAVSLSTVSSIAAFTFIIRWRDTRDKIGWLALIILAVLVVSSVALLGVVSSKDCWLDYQVYRALCQGLLIWNSSLLGVYEVFTF